MKKYIYLVVFLVSVSAYSQEITSSLNSQLDSMIVDVIDTKIKELSDYLVILLVAEKDTLSDNKTCFILYQLYNAYEYKAAVDANYYFKVDDVPVIIVDNSLISKVKASDLGWMPMDISKHISFAQRLYPDALGGVLSHSKYKYLCDGL